MLKLKSITKLTTLTLLAVAVITSGLRCTLLPSGDKALLEPITLSWWGTQDVPDNFSEVIADYRAVHPNITITYRQLRESEFEQELINALAEDRGPDIFSIPNTEVDKYLSKITPLPAKTKVAYQTTQKALGIKQETVVEIREEPSISAGQLKNAFVDVVYNDVVRENKIYGLALSVDTLALFYNRTLLNNASIPLPPTTWQGLQEAVKRLTVQNTDGKITQSGVAMGTANNNSYAFDIVSLLMMQNGAEMILGNQVLFARVPAGGSRTYNPGPEAVRFYVDFATPTKEVYTWNTDQPNSVDAFAAGSVAMIFAYQKDVATLLTKRGGKLNYGIAKVPQIEGRGAVTIASYQIHTVSSKSKRANEAWNFLQFITTNSTEAKKYLDKTNRPTALRTLITQQATNDNLTVFAEQLLSSRSWYHGQNVSAAKNAFAEMISTVLAGGSLEDATNIAAQKIQQTL